MKWIQQWIGVYRIFEFIITFSFFIHQITAETFAAAEKNIENKKLFLKSKAQRKKKVKIKLEWKHAIMLAS